MARIDTDARIKALKLAFLTCAALAFFAIPKEYLGEKFPLCLFRVLTKHECPGCGTTRAFWCVLHLRFRDAYAYNARVFITFPLLLLCASEWVFRYKGRLTAGIACAARRIVRRREPR